MDLSFLTPEIFNALILLNIAVGIALAIWRFRADLTRQPELSIDDFAHLEDTRPRSEAAVQTTDEQGQQQNNS